MADVRPFNAVTYDPVKVPDLGLVTCPPYDVISDADRDALYNRHPYNAVRIISGRREATDDGDRNQYVRACGFFRSWLWEGMLREDERQAMFVYRQSFEDPTGATRRVWGLLATDSLDDEILAHEKTMAGPKADRLALMQALPANTSPIYALYREDGGPGGSGAVSNDLSSYSREPTVADFTDAEGTRHTVWVVHDEAFHDKVRSALAPSPILIADGHHRFETAKHYRDLRREADGPGPWDHIMTLLVDVGAQPVLILPYHRIVRAATGDPKQIASDAFPMTDLGEATDATVRAFEDALWKEPAFALIADGHLYRLEIPDDAGDDIPAGVLMDRVLRPLGITSVEEGLSFTPHGTLVASEVASGSAVCGFLIPPVDVETIWSHAASGGKMPEKSTYFHPKPRDGIVMRPLGPC
ncbi:MAG: DUF1015 domain-containing protein [Actinomycetota bacterium]